MEVKSGVKSLEILMDEAERLTNLINQREIWLADPANKQKYNWNEVNRDTTEMIWNLKELKADLDELKKAQ